ncbi:MAG: BamA/OMP85 family outer membrane protein [Bacillota bacterium]
MKKYALGILILTLIVSITLGAETVQADDILTDIVIEGNENVSDEEIMDVIESEVGEEYDRTQLKEDMETVYDLGYFEDINVNFQSTSEGLKAIFEVKEFPVLKEINISGLEDIYSEEEITEELGVSEGEIFNVERLNSGISELRLRFQEEGYGLARFDDVDISPEGVLDIQINIGYLDEIKLEGNEKTRDYVILRELDIEPGDPVNFNKIQESYQNLYMLEYFEDIYPDLVMSDEDENLANLVLEMEEGNTGSLNFGGGYRQDRDGEGNWFAFGDIEEKNLFGRGQTLSFDLQLGDEREYNLGFQEPHVNGTDLSFGFNIYDQLRSLDPEKRIRGFTTTFGHPITETWDGEFKFKNERNLTDEQTSRSITLTGSRDTRENPVFPQSGGIDRFSTEFAGYVIGGDSKFIKYGTDNRRYFTGFKDDHAVALRLDTGFSNTELPLTEKYRIGGPDTLRGYTSRSGDNKALFNIEYRLQMIDNVQGVIFGDAGQVWDDGEDLKGSETDHSVGLGVRLNTPLGQLRLDYAFDKDWDGTPHLSFGQTF